MKDSELYAATRKLRVAECPECGSKLNACTGMANYEEGTIPVEGQHTVCVYCGTLLRFASHGFTYGTVEDYKEIVAFQMLEMIEKAIGKPVRVKPRKESHDR